MIHYPVHIIGFIVFAGLAMLTFDAYRRALRRSPQDLVQRWVRLLFLSFALMFLFWSGDELRLAFAVPRMISYWGAPQIVNATVLSIALVTLVIALFTPAKRMPPM